MKKRILIIIFFTFLFAIHSIAKNNMLDIDSGKKGLVSFSHINHQKIANDCKECHTFFSQKKGAIQSQISKKQLKKMQVMNKVCIFCHKSLKKKANKSAPVKCSGCHKK